MILTSNNKGKAEGGTGVERTGTQFKESEFEVSSVHVELFRSCLIYKSRVLE